MINGVLWLLLGLVFGFVSSSLMRRPTAVTILNFLFTTIGALVLGAVATTLMNNGVPETLSLIGIVVSLIGAILGHIFILFANAI